MFGWITIDPQGQTSKPHGSGSGDWQFHREKPGAGGLPAFLFSRFPAGKVKTLAAPDVLFGLWLGSSTKDADLKEQWSKGKSLKTEAFVSIMNALRKRERSSEPKAAAENLVLLFQELDSVIQQRECRGWSALTHVSSQMVRTYDFHRLQSVGQCGNVLPELRATLQKLRSVLS